MDGEKERTHSLKLMFGVVFSHLLIRDGKELFSTFVWEDRGSLSPKETLGLHADFCHVLQLLYKQTTNVSFF